MIVARPLVAGVDDVRRAAQQPLGARPLPVGLRHAVRLPGSIAGSMAPPPITLNCLTFALSLGVWPASRWCAAWGLSFDFSLARFPRWPQCSALRQHPALELLLQAEANADFATPASPSSSSPVNAGSQVAEQFYIGDSCCSQEMLHLPPAARMESYSYSSAHWRDAIQGPCEPLDEEQRATASRQPLLTGLLAPAAAAALDDDGEELPCLCRQDSRDSVDSDWSFLSASLRTVESVELSEELEPSDDDRPSVAAESPIAAALRPFSPILRPLTRSWR